MDVQERRLSAGLSPNSRRNSTSYQYNPTESVPTNRPTPASIALRIALPCAFARDYARGRSLPQVTFGPAHVVCTTGRLPTPRLRPLWPIAIHIRTRVAHLLPTVLTDIGNERGIVLCVMTGKELEQPVVVAR